MQKLRHSCIPRRTHCCASAVLHCWGHGLAHAQWPWSAWGEEEPTGTPEWWKKHKKHAVFDPEKGYQVEGVEGYFDGDGRPIQGPVAVGARRRSRRGPRGDGTHSRARSARAVRQNEIGRRVGAERAIRPSCLRRRRSAVYRQGIFRSGRRKVRRSRRARAAFADRAGCHVHARRELLLWRPLHQGPRRLRRACEGAPEHALSRYRDRPRVEHRPVLGESTNNTAPTG